MSPTPEQAKAKATEWADRGGPDGRLKPQDRDRYIAELTHQFLEMDREDFEAY